ncbi:MAG: SUMF1/EgtB/PvdO family nonheme iron enzyme [Vulcanimicrobiota bacterium]
MKHHKKVFRQKDPQALLAMAREALSSGERAMAASILDRAYGLNPEFQEVAGLRQALLEEMSREHDGVMFRYVPAGFYLMGSDRGEADERPVHPVFVEPFWMAEIPVDWEWLSRGMGYKPPPWGMPEGGGFSAGFVWEIRQQYCEDATRRASDWHNHFYEAIGEEGWPYRPQRSPVTHGYGQKPVVAVHLQEALEFCQRTQTRLPSEAEWEKAARGGLIQKRYAWGDQPATRERCDFHRFEEFSLLPSRSFPANGYGIHHMCGGVWEWTSTGYDALAYRGKWSFGLARQPVVRGGCWADCAEAVTVSFRNSRPLEGRANPNQGLRVCLA